jgi:formate dehydrogenase accessory protein FdhD
MLRDKAELTECYKVNFKERKLVKDKVIVSVEAPVRIYVNKELVANLSSTPTMLKELAIGFLFGQGIIKSLNEISEVKVGKNVIYVECSKNLKERIKVSSIINTVDDSCVSYEDFYRVLDRIDKPIVNSKYSVSIDEVKRMIRETSENSELYKKGCAIHSSALFEDGNLRFIAEDVGRNNATDKVIGAALLNNVNFNNSVHITSGRQGASSVIKLARAGIPISISMKGAIHSGIFVAEKANITLMSLSKSYGLLIYSCPQRILL